RRSAPDRIREGRESYKLKQRSPVRQKRWRPGFGSVGSVDVEREVLVVDLLVGAVGDDFRQRLVQPLTQFVVALAHGDGDLVIVEHRLALEFEVAAGVAVVPLSR